MRGEAPLVRRLRSPHARKYLALCRRAPEHAWFRLWEALREQRDPYFAQCVRQQLDNLEPLYLLAQKQRRTLGALY